MRDQLPGGVLRRLWPERGVQYRPNADCGLSRDPGSGEPDSRDGCRRDGRFAASRSSIVRPVAPGVEQLGRLLPGIAVWIAAIAVLRPDCLRNTFNVFWRQSVALGGDVGTRWREVMHDG